MLFEDNKSADDILQEFFTKAGKTMSYGRGETIIRTGDDPAGLYIIQKGFVKIHSENARAEHYLHIVYGQHELFPLYRLIDRTEARTHYSAFTDCTVVRMSTDTIDRILQDDFEVTRALLHKAVEQFRLYTTRIENLQYKFARERLIYCLLFFAGRFGVHQADGSYLLQAPLTQQLIGEFINLSRESVSREFERLRQLDLIDYAGPSLVIKDWERLGQEFKDPIEPAWWGLLKKEPAAEA